MSHTPRRWGPRWPRWLAVALIVAAVAATLVGGDASRPLGNLVRGTRACPGGQRTGPVAVGAQVHPLWSDRRAYPRIDSLLAAAGARWTRIDVGWNDFEPERGSYSEEITRAVRAVVDDAHAKGLRVLVTFWATPGWANGDRRSNTPPTDPQDYANAISHLASRLHGRVAAWEIWNEPNVADFFSGSVEQYAAMVRVAGRAIKRVDRDAIVVLGGPSTNDDRWLERLYRAGIRGSFDVVGAHPYPSPSNDPPTLADDGSRYRFSHLSVMRAVMVRNGDSRRPIWITEVGWSTGEPSDPEPYQRGVTPAIQARDLTDTLRVVEACYPFVDVVIWYNARDRADGNRRERGFGLLTRRLAKKPSYAALVAARAQSR